MMSRATSKKIRKTSSKGMNANLDQLSAKATQYHIQGEYKKALQICLQAGKLMPNNGKVWLDAGVNSIKLAQWDDAILYCNRALKNGIKNFRLYDTLSHAYGAKKQWDKVKAMGSIALTLRNQQFSKSVEPIKAFALPPKPSEQTRKKNIISFSLFGGLSKYCETAVINVQEQKNIYPNWICRFYIDETVPAVIVERLKSEGAEIIFVSDEYRHLPGPMWRFIALNDPAIDRIIFRDADSVISMREQKAVEEWVESGCYFHGMRDGHSHTELILAGLWGAIPQALPDMSDALKNYSKVLTSQHFADQHFLREYIWPYFKQSLIQHDSLFGFLEGKPFPDGPRQDAFHVGCCEGGMIFTMPTQFPEGSSIQWQFIDKRGGDHVVCGYTAIVQNGTVSDCIPDRYGKLIEENQATINIKLA